MGKESSVEKATSSRLGNLRPEYPISGWDHDVVHRLPELRRRILV
ncbi:hypothetical protein ACFYKX_10450 [Cytobacillus sp. FJAT-54145]|uniref:Uncharacterized protein n=1 Tax=Cytobacillus spartinae TaxID=3299023 RepID=A0ABW6KA17_9BACI